MKKQLSAVFVAVLTLSSSAFAIYDPSWERPMLTAFDMEITDAQYGFEKAERVDLTLTKRDGQKKATGIILSVDYAHSNAPVVNELKITDIRKDSCGSTVYSARLEDKKGNKGMEARMNVTLVDHAARLCDDYKPFRWEADVRQGYGWCGTGDATMSLQGEPEAVMTIQSL